MGETAAWCTREVRSRPSRSEATKLSDEVKTSTWITVRVVRPRPGVRARTPCSTSPGCTVIDVVHDVGPASRSRWRPTRTSQAARVLRGGGGGGMGGGAHAGGRAVFRDPGDVVLGQAAVAVPRASLCGVGTFSETHQIAAAGPG